MWPCPSSDDGNHSTTCHNALILIWFDFAAILYMAVSFVLGTFCERRGLLVIQSDLYTVPFLARAVQMTMIFIVTFVLESWVVRAGIEPEASDPLLYERLMIASKAFSHSLYLLIMAIYARMPRRNGGNRSPMLNPLMTSYMLIRVILYFVYFFDTDTSSSINTGIMGVLIDVRDVARIILSILTASELGMFVYIKVTQICTTREIHGNEYLNLDNDAARSKLASLPIRAVWMTSKQLFRSHPWTFTTAIFSRFGGAVLLIILSQKSAVMLDQNLSDGGVQTDSASTVALLSLGLFGLNVLSQRNWLCIAEIATESTLIAIQQNLQASQLLQSHFIELFYFFQDNVIVVLVSTMKIVFCATYALSISYNLGLLALFLIPMAIPFKWWETSFSTRRKREYTDAQVDAFASFNRITQEDPPAGQSRQEADLGVFRRMLNLMQSLSIAEALLCQFSYLFLSLSAIMYVWLSDGYSSTEVLEVFFFIGIAAQAFTELSENIVHMFSTVGVLEPVFQALVDPNGETAGLVANPADNDVENQRVTTEQSRKDEDAVANEATKRFWITFAVSMLFVAAFGVGVYFVIDAHQTVKVDCRIIVGGGGIGGLWTALRLQEAGLSVCILELQDHVGGRLLSSTFDGAPNVVIELGGMQIMMAHKMVVHTVSQYPDMAFFPREFPPENFDYLRNTRVEGGDWYNGTFPYNMFPSDKDYLKQFGGSVTPFVFAEKAMALAGLSPSDSEHDSCWWEGYKNTATWPINGTVPVTQLGWWFAMQATIDDEALAAYKESGGYDSFLEQSSLAEVLQTVTRGYNSDSQVEYRFYGGYQRLAFHLRDKFLSKGGIIHYNTKIVAVSDLDPTNGDPVVQLQLQDGSNLTASKVVFSMSQSALLDIDGLPQLFPLNNFGTSALDSVFPVPAFKMFLIFDSPWWTRFGFRTGEMVTTLPARKLYYWGIQEDFAQLLELMSSRSPDWEETAKHFYHPSGRWGSDSVLSDRERLGNSSILNNNSIILAGYNDDDASLYWSRMLADYEHMVPFYFAPNPSLQENHTFIDLQGSDQRAVMARSMMQQMREAHNDPTIPDPFGAVFMDWNRAPFGGGWHAWRVGADSSHVRQILRKSPTGSNIHICGEAYSDEQGWVEGALRTCEKLLIDEFTLPSNWTEYLQCL